MFCILEMCIYIIIFFKENLICRLSMVKVCPKKKFFYRAHIGKIKNFDAFFEKEAYMGFLGTLHI